MDHWISALDQMTSLLRSCEYRVESETRTINLVLWFFILDSTSQPFVCRDVVKLLLFSHQVVSNALQPYGLQQARLPCPSLSPRVCSNYYEDILKSDWLLGP